MKIAEVRKLSTKELTDHSVTINDEIAELKRRVRTGELKNVRTIRNKRRDLARVLTVLSEQLSKETNV